MTDWTPGELMAVAAGRLLEDGKVVFAGVGMPILAALLAQGRQAPNLTIALEGGIIGPELAPGRLPISTNEMRAARLAPYLTDIADVFLSAQRGFFDYGFLGAAQGRHVRQHQLIHHRRPRRPHGAASRNRGSQRHRLAVPRGFRRHHARAEAIRRARRFHPRVPATSKADPHAAMPGSCSETSQRS